jgi:hypothetical protein
LAETCSRYEQIHAFFPGLPALILCVAGTVMAPFHGVLGTQNTLILSGVAVSNVAFVLAVLTLYK